MINRKHEYRTNKYFDIIIPWQLTIFITLSYNIIFDLSFFDHYLRDCFLICFWWLSSDEWERSSFCILLRPSLVIREWVRFCMSGTIWAGTFNSLTSFIGNIMECKFFWVDGRAFFTWGPNFREVRLFLDGVSEVLLLLELELRPLRLLSSSFAWDTADFRLPLLDRLLDFLGVIRLDLGSFFDEATVNAVDDNLPWFA